MNFNDMTYSEIEEYIIGELKDKDTMCIDDTGYVSYQQFLSDVHIGDEGLERYEDVLFDMDEPVLASIWDMNH